MSVPADYLERVYAGVIGKVVGVYLGRPFEGWPRERILSKLGHVRYYVQGKVKYPLLPSGIHPMIIVDDDVSGTFMSVRALEEHGVENLTAENVGRTWLNNIVEGRSVFSWGGRGISTEHTAYLNLKDGIPGGLSGAIKTNGKVVAEQIGGEIFIDAFALCAPGNTDLAASLARAAASVSHDGESVYGAIMWAVMEAEAFINGDVNHLIDVGLNYIPKDCLITKSALDICAWAKEDGDWETTRDRIEEKYGNDKYPGGCHVVPNHSIKILSLVYGGHSFHEVTCGWDTDSNGGNVGALLGVMHGLKGFDNGPDWRGPLADRTLISTADGGFSVNNSTRLAYDIAAIGRAIAKEPPLEKPKNGAQFHFSLPGGVQGFQTELNPLIPELVKIEQGRYQDIPGLAIRLNGLSVANDAINVMTSTFIPPEELPLLHFQAQACPLIYPGQEIEAVVRMESTADDSATVKVSLCLQAYSSIDSFLTINGPQCLIKAGDKQCLRFVIPDSFDHQPIYKVGLTFSTEDTHVIKETLWLEYLRWNGSPKMTLRKPKKSTWQSNDDEPWRRAWINNVSTFPWYRQHFVIAQSKGEGGIFHGCRDWFDYSVTAKRLVNHNPGPSGLAVRVQGLRRWYAMLFKPGKIVFIKALDERRIELASEEHDWSLQKSYDITISANGSNFKGYINGQEIISVDDSQFCSGGIGLIVTEGALSVEELEIHE